MINLVFDLETTPTDDPTQIEEISASVKPPSTMSKPETIAKWVENDKPGAVADAIAKTSLDGTYGRICCIGRAWGDAKASARCSSDEAGLIAEFFDEVSSAVRSAKVPLRLIGHNIIGFDLPFLWKRAVLQGIKPPACIDFRAKPWGDSVCDTMLMWDNDKQKRISLDRLCRVLGVPTSKSDMDGSKVAEYFRNGRFEEIASYCADDVAATRACFNRLSFASCPF